ncbi:MAG TPA: hypothetical protein VK674_00165 [Candidatus Limnocylindria bacterium]|nr:hypothetical protein [Candidatus Limnocylindria bacterium]
MKLLKFSPVARAIGVISAVTVLVGGVTFAALQSEATLTNNTLSAPDSSLLIWDGAVFAATAPGFAVEDLVPGDWTEENFFYFQNDSDANLDVKAAASAPTTLEGITAEDVKVRFTSYAPECEGANTVETTLAELALVDGDVELPCNSLSEDATGNGGVEETEGNYSVSYKILPEDVTDDDVNVGSFDYTFTGTIVGSGEDEES